MTNEIDIRQTILDAIATGGPDRVIAHRGRGEPVTAGEMIRMIEQGHPDGAEYVRTVISAAVRLVSVRASAVTG